MSLSASSGVRRNVRRCHGGDGGSRGIPAKGCRCRLSCVPVLPGMLGCHVPASLSRTGDLDIGQFRSIALAVEDRIDGDLESVLKKVDKRFEGISNPIDGRQTLRYALRVGGDERFSVDVLRPMRGPDTSMVGSLPALRSDAQFLRYLDFRFIRRSTASRCTALGFLSTCPIPQGLRSISSLCPSCGGKMIPEALRNHAKT